MNLSEAFRKSIKSYFEDDNTDNLSSVLETERKYTKAYFDSVAKSFGLEDDEDEDD